MSEVIIDEKRVRHTSTLSPYALLHRSEYIEHGRRALLKTFLLRVLVFDCLCGICKHLLFTWHRCVQVRKVDKGQRADPGLPQDFRKFAQCLLQRLRVGYRRLALCYAVEA